MKPAEYRKMMKLVRLLKLQANKCDKRSARLFNKCKHDKNNDAEWTEAWDLEGRAIGFNLSAALLAEILRLLK